MKNIGLILEYDGTRYSGWQKQNNTSNTIQNKLENIINTLFEDYIERKGNIEIHASGRTDAGVHARGQVVNFWVETNITNLEIKNYINKYLPEDIRVIDVLDKSPRFHSRLNVKYKTYKYYIDISDRADVFNRKYSWNINQELSIDKMISATSLLMGEFDFAGFTDMKTRKKSTTRKIISINIEKNKNIISIEFKGDGFLYHMIRILTAYLVGVGLGEIDKEEIVKVLNNKLRDKNIQLAPAKGLFLEKVEY